ncbi:hypothetical protein DIPPA_11425 [Diplonema papillatum]|nr:hypothetical protein DIPPA_11425 [Diplonema papillatum]
MARGWGLLAAVIVGSALAGPVMEITDGDGRKAILAGRVVAGPWVRVDGERDTEAGSGYDCKCNRQNQCHCRTAKTRKYPSASQVLEGVHHGGAGFQYGLVAKMKAKYLVNHLSGHPRFDELKSKVVSAPADVADWRVELVVEINAALHDTQRRRKMRHDLPLLECADTCKPVGHPVLAGASYNCSACEDNGLGGCSCAGFCCCPTCPC